MHRRLILAGLAATGGLLTSAFLQVAVAAADAAADVSATGADAFTIGGYTFDPYTSPGVEGWDPVAPLSAAPPFLTLGGGEALGIIPLASQNFEVYDPSTGTDLGGVDTNESVSDLFGLTNAEFVVTGDSAAAGGSTSDLPTVGSVYDSFNLGNGYENVYTDIPSTTGGADTVTDTLITPNGDINLDSLFGSIDAAAPCNPATPSPGSTQATAASAPTPSPSAAYPRPAPWRAEAKASTPVIPLASTPPVLDIGGGRSVSTPTTPASTLLPKASMSTAADTSTTDIGTITTGEDITNLLGFTNTQLVVTGATAADGGGASTCRQLDRSTTRST